MKWLTGVILALGYLAVAFVSFQLGLLPARPLFDGLGPPPDYRWVNPPPNAQTNQAPLSAETHVTFTATDSPGGQVTTGDVQAQVVVPQGAIPQTKGETEAIFRIVPIDPATLAAAPPGLGFDSNAYKFEAVYGKSGTPVTFAKQISVVMRYATAAQDLYLLNAGAWQKAGAENATASLQMFLQTQSLGTFVALAPPQPAITPKITTRSPSKAKGSLLPWVVAAGGVIGLVAGLFVARLNRRKPSRKGRPKPRSPKK